MRKTITEYFHQYRHLKNQTEALPSGDVKSIRQAILARVYREIINADMKLEEGKAIDDICNRIDKLISQITN